MRASALTMMAFLSGCGVSPEDLFEFTGVVTSAGEALTGQRVEAKRETAIGLDLSARSWPAMPCSVDKTLATTSTDGTGRFDIELFRVQVERPSDELLTSGSYCIRFNTEAEGTSSWVDVRPWAQQNELGALAIWRPDARLDGASPDGGLLLSFDGPPTVSSFDSRVRVSLVSAEGVWWDSVIDLTDAGVTRVTTELAAQWLEDRQVSVRLEAGAMGWESSPQQLIGGGSYAPVRFGQLATTGLVLTGSATPPSRGASCASIGSPCPLTDGSPAPVAMDGGTSVELELQSPMVVRRVGVRGRRNAPVSLGPGGSQTPTYWYDSVALVQLETGETRLLTAVDPDAGVPDLVPSVFGPSLFLELDGYFVLEVPKPLLGQRFRLIFPQPLDSLAEVSLLEH